LCVILSNLVELLPTVGNLFWVLLTLFFQTVTSVTCLFGMAAHESAIADIVSNIHTYAGDKQLPQVFHAFMLAIVFARPSNPLEHISQEASKMKGKAVIEEPPLVRAWS
jgi:hypothetical protein